LAGGWCSEILFTGGFSRPAGTPRGARTLVQNPLKIIFLYQPAKAGSLNHIWSVI